jgi:hypothetical protein
LFYQDSNDDISFTFLISKLIPLDGDAARWQDSVKTT